MAQPVLHIALSASEEVVSHSDLMALHHEAVHQVGAYKPCPACDLGRKVHTATVQPTVNLL